MVYNLTNLSGSTNLYTDFYIINNILKGYPAGLFLYTLFIILLVLFRFAGLVESILAASFICLVFGIIFVYLNLVSWLVLSGFIAFLIGSIIYLLVKGG